MMKFLVILSATKNPEKHKTTRFFIPLSLHSAWHTNTIPVILRRSRRILGVSVILNRRLAQLSWVKNLGKHKATRFFLPRLAGKISVRYIQNNTHSNIKKLIYIPVNCRLTYKNYHQSQLDVTTNPFQSCLITILNFQDWHKSTSLGVNISGWYSYA